MNYFMQFLCLIGFLSPVLLANPMTKSLHDEKLGKVIANYTLSSKKLDAYRATRYNLEEDFDKFGDYASPAYFDRAKQILLTAAADLKAVSSDGLSPDETLDYLLFKKTVEMELKSFDFPSRYLEFNQMDNRLISYLDETSQSLTSFPFDTVKHYDAFVKRSEGFLPYVDHQIALFDEGVKKKVVLSCIVAEKTINTYGEGLISDVEKHPFWRPIGFMPGSFSAKDQSRLKDDFRKMITERVLPGYKKFDSYFRSTYLPQCRKNFGMADLPDAKAWYLHNIERSTSLVLQPEELHQLGLKEVETIVAKMDTIKTKLGFKGTYQEFTHSLLENQKYFFKNSADMFAAFTKTKEIIHEKIKDYFDLVPKSEVRLVETSNPEDAAGRYYEPTDLQPYGRFVVNTKNLRAIPSYGINSLMMHETIPGHHFQLALAYEMKDKLSEFRRLFFESNAFVEGWALYSEFLGNEMGIFKDPLQEIGHLNDELLRAVRLVVDTGIHHYNWSQKQTIDYMKKYLASDINDITNEANRYSIWPGQALGYKVGQLKIMELRKWAEKELGEKFQIKDFHRVVLGEGVLSLEVLDRQVKAWVKNTKSV
ncbi:MAG: DUF885 domain-containing protein [Oligoflexales bacterium]|nr:DUF885 domain-containing protein [Oligoflexales bacterium]